MHLVFESEHTGGKEAYQGLATGAKMEGIMESLAQKAKSSLQGKIRAKKKELRMKVSGFVKTQHRIAVVERDIKSVFTLLHLYCLSSQHH